MHAALPRVMQATNSMQALLVAAPRAAAAPDPECVAAVLRFSAAVLSAAEEPRRGDGEGWSQDNAARAAAARAAAEACGEQTVSALRLLLLLVMINRARPLDTDSRSSSPLRRNRDHSGRASDRYVPVSAPVAHAARGRGLEGRSRRSSVACSGRRSERGGHKFGGDWRGRHRALALCDSGAKTAAAQNTAADG